ncbi:zinc finger-containing ubiquitin peptidase 1 isoform 1-T2 [Discoglossus pictus]
MFVCDICTQEVPSEADMKSHMLLVHIEQEASCPVCTIAGLTYDELNYHMLTVHGDIQEPWANNVQSESDERQENPVTQISSTSITFCEEYHLGTCAKSCSDQPKLKIHSDNNLQRNQKLKNVQSEVNKNEAPCTSSSAIARSNSIFKVDDHCSSSALCMNIPENEICQESSSQAQTRASILSHSYDMEVILDCPFCIEMQASVEELESHVQTKHADLLDTPTKGDAQQQYECPMCSLVCATCQILEEHVNLHLEESSFHEGASSKNTADLNLARQLQDEENRCKRAEESQREQEEFQKLQRQFGLDNTGGYKQQSLQNMEKAVARGRMLPMDFHLQKAEMLESLATGIDDGRTRTSGILQALLRYYQNAASEVSRVWLCSPLDHFSSSQGDKGWGCGPRNIQMLLSSLLLNDTYRNCLQECRFVPCIPKIQSMIESAWKEGFDPQGASHFNGRLQGTKAWIGACEVYCLLTSMLLKCRIIDFHKPSSQSGTHPFLFEWVLNYYSSDTRSGKVICTSKPAIYLQHQGHSRTIVGIEERKNKTYCLLLFDPGCPAGIMQKLLNQNLDGAALKPLRKYLGSLKHKQYQIVAVEGMLSSEEKAVRLQNSKIFKSERIP